MALWMEETEPTWKKQRRSWRDQTLSNLSLPPPSLLLLLFIVLLLLSLSARSALRSDDASLSIRFVTHLAMAAAPVLLIFFVVRWMLVNGRSSLPRVPVMMMMSPNGAGGSPWGVAAAVVLLLVLVSYQSRFLSQWSGPL